MIVTAGQVRRAVELLLQDGTPAVLAALADRDGIDLPPFRSWNRPTDFLLIPEAQTPACAVTTPGIVGVPLPAAPGRAQVVEWGVRVYVVCRGRTFEETADRTAAYVAAVRTVVLAARRLDGLSTSVTWQGETYAEAPVPTDQTRTVGAGSVTFTFPGVQTGTNP